jgi:hypothetical protein
MNPIYSIKCKKNEKINIEEIEGMQAGVVVGTLKPLQMDYPVFAGGQIYPIQNMIGIEEENEIFVFVDNTIRYHDSFSLTKKKVITLTDGQSIYVAAGTVTIGDKTYSEKTWINVTYKKRVTLVPGSQLEPILFIFKKT